MYTIEDHYSWTGVLFSSVAACPGRSLTINYELRTWSFGWDTNRRTIARPCGVFNMMLQLHHWAVVAVKNVEELGYGPHSSPYTPGLHESMIVHIQS
eukprot:jgi/Psemu1/36663/gm1.36663_g